MDVSKSDMHLLFCNSQAADQSVCVHTRVLLGMEQGQASALSLSSLFFKQGLAIQSILV